MTAATPMHRAPLGQPTGTARIRTSGPQISTTAQHPAHTYNSNYPGSSQRGSTGVRHQFPAPGGRSTSGNYGIQAGMKVGAVPGGGPYLQRPVSYSNGGRFRDVFPIQCADSRQIRFSQTTPKQDPTVEATNKEAMRTTSTEKRKPGRSSAQLGLSRERVA